MAKINVVLADTDELFLNHLTNYLIQHVNTFEVFSFTTKDSIQRFISDKRCKVDVIAFTEELMCDSIASADIPVKVLLSDGSFSELEGFEAVNKYQKAEKFVNEILLKYAEETGRVEAVSLGDKDTKIIGVYSPIGGSGKTTIGLSLACALGIQGKRAFYLNAEKINSTTEYLNRGESGSLSDLYLSIKTKGSNVGLKVMSNKTSDFEYNFSYINPAESSLEINELTAEEFIRLMKEFEKLGEYDYVIVDFESELSNDKIEILDSMDVIVSPFLPNDVSVNKMALFLKELNMYDEFKTILGKILPVLNKYDSRVGFNFENCIISDFCDVNVKVEFSALFDNIRAMLCSGNSVVSLISGVLHRI